MLPLCCLCPCCLCSGFQPAAPLWLRPHIWFVPLLFLSGKSTGSFATSATKRWGGRSLGTVCLFAHPPHPISICLLNCRKWSPTSWVILKKFLSSCNYKDGHLSPPSFVFYERERRIYVPGKLELWLEKKLKKYYRSAMSLHKSDKNVI